MKWHWPPIDNSEFWIYIICIFVVVITIILILVKIFG